MAMKPVDLVFRCVGERTAKVALELAVANIRPARVHVLQDVRPFSECVRRQLQIQHDAELVVYVDGDCLILQDLRPFLEGNDLPYVDSYVRDRYRGAIHCGVHITRRDVIAAMAATPPPDNDLAYVLRPESRLRQIALRKVGLDKVFKSFVILHDWFQWYRDVFAKYALRELRSRDEMQRARLEMAMTSWDRTPDFEVARAAIEHARAHVPIGASPAEHRAYIERLPVVAEQITSAMGLPAQEPFTMDTLKQALAGDPGLAATPERPKVFGLGLSRTGTRSLTSALAILGIDCIHYPIDAGTLGALTSGRFDFPLLRQYDGLTDITVAPYYPQLDRLYPNSKFILTVRADREAWLRSCRLHYEGRPAYEETHNADEATHMEIRRFLRAAVYGCYDFDRERFSWVYDRHVAEVRRYFEDRPEDFLEIDVCAGEGFDKLAPFLRRPVPAQPFPHKGGALSRKRRAAGLEVDD